MVVRIIFAFIFYASSVEGASWSMTSRDVDFSKGLKRTSLTFKTGGLITNYLPEIPPYLMVSRTKNPLENGDSIFVTGWSYGAQTTVFRIFSSGVKTGQPICEFVSFSDEIQQRQKDGDLEFKILVRLSGDSKWKWEACSLSTSDN